MKFLSLKYEPAEMWSDLKCRDELGVQQRRLSYGETLRNSYESVRENSSELV